MKTYMFRRITAVALILCLCFTLVPVFAPIEAQAVGGIDNLTCSGFISNETAQLYIDVMMRYYLNNNSKLRTTLDNGLSVVFMFEGGSDYYWSGNNYNNSAYDVRDQAVVIVVQKNSSGNAYIDFYSENCSSIPGDPSWCTGAAYSGSVTIMDGIYPFYTTNHTGPYAALQLDMSATNGYGYYTPPSDPDGFKNGCSGINVHTRASDIAAGSDLGWAWSEGCQVIGSGSTSSNVFNSFMKSVTGITWNPWVDYYASPKNLNSFASIGQHMGYYVVDRQLGLMNNSGTEYGSGSLTALYTKTALNNITAYSTSARANADFNTNYFDRCTRYDSYCQVESLYNASLNSYPCAAGTNGSVKLETSVAGQTYTVTGLYKNHAGNFWYELITPSGKTAYIYNTSAKYLSTYTSDVKLTGQAEPQAHVKGNAFSVKGTISSTYIGLTEAGVWVHSGFGTGGAKVTGATDTISNKSYSLAGSSIDSNVLFDQLDAGKYTYVIQASYRSYFVKDEYTLMVAYGTKTLHSNYFTVIESSVSPDGCTHDYQITTTKSPTCTASGSGIQSCSICGSISTTTIAALGHQYSSWNSTEPTCTTDGFRSRSCSTCGYVQQQTVEKTGHRYMLQELKASCIREADYYYECANCGDKNWLDLVTLRSQWQETIPEGLSEDLFISKVQYRFRDTADSDWSEWSDEAPQSGDDRQVEQRTVYLMKEASYGPHDWQEGVCSVCYLPCTHRYENNKCTNCGYRKVDNRYFLFGYINGANYACEEDSENAGDYLFENGQLVATFKDRCYVAVKTGDNRTWYMADGYPGDEATCTTLYSTTITGERSDKLSVPKGKKITFTLIENEDGSLTLSYTADDCEHQWVDGTCQACGEECVHQVWTHGACGSCGLVCPHESWTEGVCDLCGFDCKHSFADNVCTVCGSERTQKDFYLFGFINGRDYGCEADYSTMGEYLFVDGQLQAAFRENSYVAVKSDDNQDWYMAQQWLGEEATSAPLYLTITGAYEKLFVPGGKIVTFTLVDNGDSSLLLSYEAVDCPHSKHDRDGLCTVCRQDVGHDYDRVTTAPTCGSAGSIVDTCSICGSSISETIPALEHQMESAITAPTCSLDGYTTHICTECGYRYTDSNIPALGHQYVDGYCKNCGREYAGSLTTPTLSLKYPSLSMEDEIVMNIYFAAEQLQDVSEIGLITYREKVTEWSLDTADAVIPGYGYNKSDGLYFASTAGIAPKDLGDTIYFSLYAKLSNGTCIYTKLTGYSPKTYAYNQLKSGTQQMKTLVVAMLNFGAAAQSYFGYKTEDLVNASITQEQQALISEYHGDMMDAIIKADPNKAGIFASSGGFARAYPTISFEGAFSIHYFFSLSNQPDGNVRMYYWNEADYLAADTLSGSNVTGSFNLLQDENGLYYGDVTDIAAKDIDDTIYVCAAYRSGGTLYCTGVLAYSIGAYCKSQAAGSTAMAPLAQATAVYSYYAKDYFLKNA